MGMVDECHAPATFAGWSPSLPLSKGLARAKNSSGQGDKDKYSVIKLCSALAT